MNDPMNDPINDVVEQIKEKLAIKGGSLIDAEIEMHLAEVDPKKMLSFFMALSGDEFKYLKSMDRIAVVAKKFQKEKMDGLFAGTLELAKEMYGKFYALQGRMTGFSQANRNLIPSDREFFQNFKYKTALGSDGKQFLSSKELQMLKKLGGGGWLMKMRYFANSKEGVDKIEQIIKNDRVNRYMTSDENAIDHKVQSVLPSKLTA